MPNVGRPTSSLNNGSRPTSSHERVNNASAAAAAAANRRRESIRERGREMITADKMLIARKRRAQSATTKYPKSDILSLKCIFDEYDFDGSGTLSRQELTQALRRRKLEATSWSAKSKAKTLAQRQAQAGIFLVDFAESLFEVLDSNSDEQVDFAELLRILYPLATAAELRTMIEWATPPKTDRQREQEEADQAEEDRMRVLRAMFAAYDRDGDGKVSITEFRMAMLDHENWDEVEDLFEQYDANGNGEVDFAEFCAIVSMEEPADEP